MRSTVLVNQSPARELAFSGNLGLLQGSLLTRYRLSGFPFHCYSTPFTDEQFDAIVGRFREYVQRAHDGGFKVGPETHWGAEVVPENMRRLCEAVDHPGFGVLLHVRSNDGDAVMAPWAMHTHISWEITENSLQRSMELLRDAGYNGCWSVEHHSGVNEYSAVAIPLATLRNVLGRW